MNELLLNTLGQSLIAIGLYTVAFESLVLTFRAQMQGYLIRNDPDSLPAFNKECATADRTLKFCEAKIVPLGLLDKTEVDALVKVRKRRNTMAHEGYNEMINLTVKDIEDDIILMFRISQKVEKWHQVVHQPNPDGSMQFPIAPSIFGLYLVAAQELARTTLNTQVSNPSRA